MLAMDTTDRKNTSAHEGAISARPDPLRLVALARPTFEEALGIAAASGMSVQNARRAAAAAAARYVTLRTGHEVSFEWVERNLR